MVTGHVTHAACIGPLTPQLMALQQSIVRRAALPNPNVHARHRSTYPATAAPEPLPVGAGVGDCSPASLSGAAVPSLLPLPISLLLVALCGKTTTLLWVYKGWELQRIRCWAGRHHQRALKPSR